MNSNERREIFLLLLKCKRVVLGSSIWSTVIKSSAVEFELLIILIIIYMYLNKNSERERDQLDGLFVRLYNIKKGVAARIIINDNTTRLPDTLNTTHINSLIENSARERDARHYQETTALIIIAIRSPR